jgi:hypothetical protein
MLTGSAGTNAALAQSANSIQTLGGFGVGGNGGLVLTDSVNLSVAGAVSADGFINLQGAGSITETSGFLVTPQLYVVAAGQASFNNSAGNQIQTVYGQAGSNFSVLNSGSLTEAGINAGGFIELYAGGGQEVSVAANMGAGTGVRIDVSAIISTDVTITSQGGASVFAGTVQSVSSSDPAALTFRAGSGSVAFMNNIGANAGSGTGIDQIPSGGAALKWVDIAANAVTLGSGQSNLIIRTIGNGTNSAPTVLGLSSHAKQGDIVFGSDPTVNAQTLTVDVTDGGLAFNSAGTINFGASGLMLPNGKLVLVLGNGLAAGSLINVATLDIYGSGGATNLFGGIAGNFSQNAVREPYAEHYTAISGFFSVSNSPNTDYKFNGCSIGGDSCFEVQAPVLPSFQVPAVQLDIKVSPPHQTVDDDDEMLPLRGNTDLWDGLF